MDEHQLSVRPELNRQLRPSRLQFWLIVGLLICYGLGYPLALAAHSMIGWLLVGLGGLVLMAFAVVTIGRIHRSGQDERPSS